MINPISIRQEIPQIALEKIDDHIGTVTEVPSNNTDVHIGMTEDRSKVLFEGNNHHINEPPKIHQVLPEDTDDDNTPQKALQPNPTIETFIFGDKNAKFPKIAKYTLKIFLERAFIIHGNVFDYTAVVEDAITCKICRYTWPVSICSHITNKSGCPSCSGTLHNTYENFMFKAEKLFVDLYTFTLITAGTKGTDTIISAEYNKCKHSRTMTTDEFLRKHKRNDKCPECKKLEPQKRLAWTYDRFIQEARHIHGINLTIVKLKDQILLIKNLFSM